ncbi:hypothetical protein OKW45_001161 [Paraburkholderia sp. WSM4175]
MENDSTVYVGLDVHKDSITVAYAIGMGDVELLGKIGTTKADIDRLCRRLQSKGPHVWTRPCITGHAVTLRLVNLLAGETRVASGISERCADAIRCSGRTRWPGFAAPSWRQAWASTRHNRASSF